MPRSKDKSPRKLSAISLANLQPRESRPGFESVSVRVFAPSSVAQRFKGMKSHERGEIVKAGFAAQP